MYHRAVESLRLGDGPQMDHYYDIAFTAPVRQLQEAKGSRSRPPQEVGDASTPQRLGPAEIEHITARDSLYLSTIGETGWPYVQHRGGAAGFVKVLDESTIGWLERNGNRQYIGTGNITADDRVALIMVDYANRQRLKLFGRATYHPQATPELITATGEEKMRSDGAITIEVAGYSWNCSKYITPRFATDQIHTLLAPYQERIADLETGLDAANQELQRLRHTDDHVPDR
ncbi:MAG: pyridoxamine 5'-phosphate oxidase family protein [Actinomycetota bacterium]